MRKPRKGTPGTTYTISCTDEQWAAITDGAARAGMRVSPWFVKCALEVDPWPAKHRRLVLDERDQRRIARAVHDHARSLGADGLAGDIGALFAARLRGMAGQGRRGRQRATVLLRSAFGAETAETVAAAFLPDAPADVSITPIESRKLDQAETPPKRPTQDETGALPVRPPQGELF